MCEKNQTKIKSTLCPDSKSPQNTFWSKMKVTGGKRKRWRMHNSSAKRFSHFKKAKRQKNISKLKVAKKIAQFNTDGLEVNTNDVHLSKRVEIMLATAHRVGSEPYRRVHRTLKGDGEQWIWGGATTTVLSSTNITDSQRI